MKNLKIVVTILFSLQVLPASADIEFDSLYLDCGTSLYAFEKNLLSSMKSAARQEGNFVRAYSHMYLGNPRIVRYEKPGEREAEISPSVIVLEYRDRIDRATGYLYDFQDTKFKNAKQCRKIDKSYLLRRIDEHNAKLRNKDMKF